MKRTMPLTLMLLASLVFAVRSARAEKVGSLVTVLGAEEISVEGIGLVVGLNGTGDSSPAALRMIRAFMERNNIALSTTDLASKNIALVHVDAKIPAFLRPGQKITVRVKSINDAKSLMNGVLKKCPLAARPGGPLLVWAEGSVSDAGPSDVIGTIPASRSGGGQVVEVIPTRVLSEDNSFTLTLKRPSFAHAHAIALAVNQDNALNPGLEEQTTWEDTNLVSKVARALDAGAVVITIPPQFLRDKTRYIADVLNKEVTILTPARVIFNRRTRTVVVTDGVRVKPGLISHRDLTVTLGPDNRIGAPEGAKKYNLEDNDPRAFIETEGYNTTPNLERLVDTLNAMGTTTNDIITILEKLIQSGMLHAELVVE